jgi:V8-like Glu-specific endopeptidase
VRLRAARPAGLQLTVRGDKETRPEDDRGPRRRARWFSRAPVAAVLFTVLAVSAVLTVTPAESAGGDIVSSFARALRHWMSTSQNGQAFAGTPAVGALFTTSDGKPAGHFCTGSVVSSPAGDLVITAAHCVTGMSGLVFAPGYDRGATPYGVWSVTKVYTDRSWQASSDPDDDVAFLQVSQHGSIVPVEDVTGAEQLATDRSARQLVEVIGYPDGTDEPIACRNWTREPMSDQLEFDCGGYTDGTSGGPFLADVNPLTGQGTVIGVIGGYEQGGLTPQVSYSSMFRANVAALYKLAVAGG